MNTTDFIHYCQQQLRKSFEQTKAGKTDDVNKPRVEGLLHAASLLEIMPKADIQSMVEKVHMDVFGETMDERNKRKVSLTELKETDPGTY